MTYYTGDPQKRRSPGELKLPTSRRARQIDPSGYKPDKGLADAVNVALMLGQPLLLTGEPGTGKTQLANSIAWELGFDPPLMFETKSTNSARDLFYTYDTLSRFHAAQTGEGSQKSLDYILTTLSAPLFCDRMMRRRCGSGCRKVSSMADGEDRSF